MSRVASLSIVLLCWAAIYLPGLGSLEIKGEEGRRILPAVTMIETGNYLVPQVGSEPYYRKPPLINWLVAASFKVTGLRNEWTARLPSALCVLAVALAFVGIARPSLGAKGSLMAALIWMVNFGMVEKGRLIEIEALYVSLFGLAFVCWVSWWQQRRSAWVTWTVPWIFLGLGLLAKGPLHLFFFYAIVVAVLYSGGELRKLSQPAHLAGIVIMLGIFAAWAVPYWQSMHGNLAATWSGEFTGRLTGDDFKLRNWILNIPRSLAYFLPWTVLLVARPGWAANAEQKLSRSLAWGCAIPFLIVSLLPGALPRYSMPLLVPACWLMAMMLTADELRWPWWPARKNIAFERRFRFVIFTAIVAGAAVCLYSLAGIPMLQRRAKVKPIAAQIEALVPESESIYAIDPDYQPFLFYMRRRLVYASRMEDVPSVARYLIVQPDKKEEAMKSERWSPRHALPVSSFTDYRKRTVILLKVSEPDR
jgi:4-amino-4-deoxy-L-arabinose transferase-like glycosyltransferase